MDNLQKRTRRLQKKTRHCEPVRTLSHPRVASLGPSGQFTFWQSPGFSGCRIGASFNRRDCHVGLWPPRNDVVTYATKKSLPENPEGNHFVFCGLVNKAHSQDADQPCSSQPLGGRSDDALAILAGLVQIGVSVAGQSTQTLVLAILHQDDGDQSNAQNRHQNRQNDFM